MSAAGSDESTGVERAAALGPAALKRRERIFEQIRIWREELINLARSNRLLYFRHTRSSTLEIVVEPDQAIDIVAALLRGGSWGFFEPPADEEREAWLPTPGELITNKDDAASLGRALRLLERKATQEFMEKGLWVLYGSRRHEGLRTFRQALPCTEKASIAGSPQQRLGLAFPQPVA